MRHGSLFSGIGGFDLAAEWMGWENVFHCEWNPFGQKVLKYYWPHSISYNDITKTDFSIHRGDIDIITGGFPCQPYSSAGKRLGKEDERHLWPEMLRCIREVSPSWIVGENVRGLTNWNGGLVFDEVQADLEAIGYEVTPFLLPACAVNAPHRRDRIWFIAKNTLQNGWGSDKRKKESSFGQFGNISTRDNEWIQTNNDEIKNAPNPNSNGQHGSNSQHEINTSQGGEYALNDFEQIIMHPNSTSKQGQHIGQSGQREFDRSDSRIAINDWQNFPSVSPICNGDDGLSNRLDSITFPKWRNESIKAGGNAVVPQVVFQIFKAIESFNNQNQKP